jgi:uncharacterized protein involved in cysteine biosynthesis
MKDIPRIMKREWQKLAWYTAPARSFVAALFIPDWPDGRAGAVVPVQRLDAGHSVLRLP